MQFYRQAKASDFEKAQAEFDSELPQHLQELIQKTGNLPKAQKDLRDNYGFNYKDAKEVCTNYWQYIHAKKDFQDGKPIYVNYM